MIFRLRIHINSLDTKNQKLERRTNNIEREIELQKQG